MRAAGLDGATCHQRRFAGARFRSRQLNLLAALTDISRGGGGTRVIPGSDRSHITTQMGARRLDARRVARHRVRSHQRGGICVCLPIVH